MKRRIFVSSPRDMYLDESRKIIKWAIVVEIETLGYEVQLFNPEDGGRGLAAGITWSTLAVEQIMKRCVGAVIIGFPFWKNCTPVDKQEGLPGVSLVTEYCQFEGAIALSCNCPILGVLEETVKKRLIFASQGGDGIISLPRNAGADWTSTIQFQQFLKAWHHRVEKRSDLFFGYASKSMGVANNIKLYLKEQFPVLKLLDWYDGFLQGDLIMHQIEEATQNCTAAIFLFTNDDKLADEYGSHEHNATMLPRDNVIFEAGFFAHAKGTKRVHIIFEKGAKVPTDLGGVIYSVLESRDDLSLIADNLKKFITYNL